jgi:hypothetical protein
LSVPRESLLALSDLEEFGGRFAECFGVLVVIRAAFFGFDLLAETLRIAFALCAAGLFVAGFFFFDLAIIQGAPAVRAPKTEA